MNINMDKNVEIDRTSGDLYTRYSDEYKDQHLALTGYPLSERAFCQISGMDIIFIYP